MVSELLLGFDETTLAYDLQRAHSADIWFLRARFFLWGMFATIGGFLIGHGIAVAGVNLYGAVWDGFWQVWYGLW